MQGLALILESICAVLHRWNITQQPFNRTRFTYQRRRRRWNKFIYLICRWCFWHSCDIPFVWLDPWHYELGRGVLYHWWHNCCLGHPMDVFCLWHAWSRSIHFRIWEELYHWKKALWWISVNNGRNIININCKLIILGFWKTWQHLWFL